MAGYETAFSNERLFIGESVEIIIDIVSAQPYNIIADTVSNENARKFPIKMQVLYSRFI